MADQNSYYLTKQNSKELTDDFLIKEEIKQKIMEVAHFVDRIYYLKDGETHLYMDILGIIFQKAKE